MAREKYRRQQEERAARQRQIRKRGLIGVGAVAGRRRSIAALLAVFLPGGSAKQPAASASKSPTASPSPSAARGGRARASLHATRRPTPVARKVSFPPATPDYTASYQATINTNLGKITFNLLNSKATCTVNSFVHLAEAGYFNNTQCHRLVTSGIYVLQCGDPYATVTTKLTCSSTSNVGTGGPGYDFASENLTGATYPAGTVAMANDGTADQQRQPVLHRVQGQHSGLTSRLIHPLPRFLPGSDIVQNVAKDGYSCQYADRPAAAPRRRRSSLTA